MTITEIKDAYDNVLFIQCNHKNKVTIDSSLPVARQEAEELLEAMYDNGCHGCTDCTNCTDCLDCVRCENCVCCVDCDSCNDCVDCIDCNGCFECDTCFFLGLTHKERLSYSRFDGVSEVNLPLLTVANIHQKVLEAVGQEGCQLDMRYWHSHTSCGTSHCRAGWVVTLAGDIGASLELCTGTAFAALCIYKASSKIRVSPVHFFDEHFDAMSHIIKCAELEKKQNETQISTQ